MFVFNRRSNKKNKCTSFHFIWRSFLFNSSKSYCSRCLCFHLPLLFLCKELCFVLLSCCAAVTMALQKQQRSASLPTLCCDKCIYVLFFAVSLLHVVVDFHLVAEYLCESLHVVGCPCLHYLSVLAEVASHQVVACLHTDKSV